MQAARFVQMIEKIEDLDRLRDDDVITNVEAALKLASTLKQWPLRISPNQLVGWLLVDLGNAYQRTKGRAR